MDEVSVIFGRSVLNGVAILASLVFIGLLLGFAVCRLRKAIKSKGWLYVMMAGLFSFAMAKYGTPTCADKEIYRQNMMQGNIANAAWAAMGVGSPYEEAMPPTDVPQLRGIVDDDYISGIVLAKIGRNETWNFSPPADAEVFQPWVCHGASDHRFRCRFTDDWTFRLGTNTVCSLNVFSAGFMRPILTNTTTFIAPLAAVYGIPRAAKWPQLEAMDSPSPSQFWQWHTPSNTLVMTWQNVLFGRMPGKSVCFQAELWPEGNVVYRYDLSRLGDCAITNIKVGVSCDGRGRIFTGMTRDVTSLKYVHLEPEWSGNDDPDGDGLTTVEEVFIYDTDPSRRDSDFDGLDDYAEINYWHTDPNNAYSLDPRYPDGIAVHIGDNDPWAFPANSTNTVFEHIFYTGSTNAPFAYPQANDEQAVLKITVSGSGVGRLVVGEQVVPLLGGARMRSAGSPNTLLLAVGKGTRKEFWFDKPEGLDIAVDSDDFLIGSIPMSSWSPGWIAFPHTDATIPCIHNLYGKSRTVALAHGVEFSGITAQWTSEAADVCITNKAPVSAEILGHFDMDETRAIAYTVQHPKQLNHTPATFTQILRFCPPLDENEDEFYPPGGMDGDGNHGENHEDEDEPADEIDEEDAMAAFTNILNGTLSPLPDVLYLYGNQPKRLTLDVSKSGHNQCCPCPEHNASNYVALAYADRKVAMCDLSGDDFLIAYEPCTVEVSGVGRSRSFGDAPVLFAANGEICERINYTVVGVKIESEDSGIPIAEYNRYSSTFGYPVTVCNSADMSDTVFLQTEVLQTNGLIRVALSNLAGAFAVWLPRWVDTQGESHSPELLLDSGGPTVRYFTISQWRRLLRRHTGSDGGRLPVKIFSPLPGHCDLQLEYVAQNGDYYVYDRARQRITAVVPPLLPDYNRDGSINMQDSSRFLTCPDFHYWVNECKIVGDVWEEPSLFEGIVDMVSGLENWRNDHVDGRFDLINLFPIAIRAEPFISAWKDSGKVCIKLFCPYGNESIRYTLADIRHSEAGSVRTAPRFNLAGEPLHRATMNWLDSIEMESSEYIRDFSENSALMVCEAAKAIWGGLRLSIEVDGKQMYSFHLPITTSPVDAMYRYVDIRGAYDHPDMEFTGIGATWNNPEAEEYGQDVFFVHGFNVSPGNAREWNREMFKRFWVSGMKARYWGVTWSGDYHAIFESFNGFTITVMSGRR